MTIKERLNSRKLWLVVGTTLLNAGLFVWGPLEAEHFVSLQMASVPAYLVGQAAVDTWGRK